MCRPFCSEEGGSEVRWLSEWAFFLGCMNIVGWEVMKKGAGAVDGGKGLSDEQTRDGLGASVSCGA